LLDELGIKMLPPDDPIYTSDITVFSIPDPPAPADEPAERDRSAFGGEDS
jgi:hypothetical protein